MSTFVDTSAFIALLIQEDESHPAAGKIWKKLVETDELLVTTNYVLVETLALLHRRSGIPTARIFIDDVLPLVQVEWINSHLHTAGTESMLMAGKNGPNIVDCANFALMRNIGINKAFTFDRHFKDQGFQIVKV